MTKNSLAPKVEIDKRLQELANAKETLLDKIEDIEDEEYMLIESTDERLQEISCAKEALLMDLKDIEDEYAALEGLKDPENGTIA